MAKLVEPRTQDPKDEGSNPVSSARKKCDFFRVKNVVLSLSPGIIVMVIAGLKAIN